MKKFVSKHELLPMINAEISKHVECPGCRIQDLIPMEISDSTNINWEQGGIRCGDRAVNNCKHVADRVTDLLKDYLCLDGI